MYQLPVENIEKIRKSRRKVKNILSELGLEDCQYLLKDLHEKSEDILVEDEAFEQTEWEDFTDCSNRTKKKWPYRSQILCCALCKYSTRNIYTFRSHVARIHEHSRSMCSLEACSECHYIGHPKALRKHVNFFHSATATVASPKVAARECPPATYSKERYQCRKCGYPSSSILAIKKHVILRHLELLAQQFIGYRMLPYGKSYVCKVCKVNIGSLDQMLHHMLVDPAHQWVNKQVLKLIYENKEYIKQLPNGNGLYLTFPSIAPKPQALTNRSVVLSNIGQQGQTVLTLQQLHGSPNNTALICAPGTNQSFLSPQASALVQLASAETKDLLPPGTSVALQNSLAQGTSMVQLPTTSISLVPAPAQSLQNPQGQQTAGKPPALQTNLTGTPGVQCQPSVVAQKSPTYQITPQGTMMTSQSLLSHLIPTGNKINGLPTYTFAPLPEAVPASKSVITPLKPVESAKNSSQPAKKWMTCPHCNELFPFNVYDMHMEIAHKTKSITAKSESLAARAPYLKKMPDKTVKCLMCKILLSEKGVIQHLLHGLNCLYCSALFFSLTQLIDHQKEHDPKAQAHCDLLRLEYRVYTDGFGQIIFPYFDINTTVANELLGDRELNMVLVTSSLDLIFLKMLPSISHPDVCQPAVRITSACCPFCYEKFQNSNKHLQHLKQKHFVAPTVHAILKTEAFKCVYCNGVYTGKLTQQAVMLHLQRCRSSPKKLPEPPLRTLDSKRMATGGIRLQQKPMQQLMQSPKLYFQIPPPMNMKQMQPLGPTQVLKPPTVLTLVPAVQTPETEKEQLSKKRLEEAWKQVVEANRREREEMAAMRKRRKEERLSAPPLQTEPESSSIISSNSNVKLLLEPTAVERHSVEERRAYILRYFNLNPYISKGESDELCRRLRLTKAELAAYFGNRRARCIKSLKRNTAVVYLGFKMNELSKVKHNLFIPEVQSAETSEQAEKHTQPGPVEESRTTVEIMDLDHVEGVEPSGKMAESNIEKDVNVDLSEGGGNTM